MDPTQETRARTKQKEYKKKGNNEHLSKNQNDLITERGRPFAGVPDMLKPFLAEGGGGTRHWCGQGATYIAFTVSPTGSVGGIPNQEPRETI